MSAPNPLVTSAGPATGIAELRDSRAASIASLARQLDAVCMADPPATPAGPDPSSTPATPPPADPAAGLPASPPGTPAATPPSTSPATPAPGQDPDTRPPWERNGETFDPERAWRRIQAAEADRDKARTTRDEHKARLDEIDRGNMTTQQQAETDRDSYRTRAEAAEWELARYEVLAEKGLKPDAARFLTGANRDELGASADALLTTFGDAVRSTPQALAPTPAPPPGGAPTQRPAEALRVPLGGSDPASQLSADDLDPIKLAGQVRRGL